jgi:hypothetical protein
MKTRRSLVFLSLLLFIFCVGILAFDDAGAAQRGKKGTGIVALTGAEKATMMYIREEEKLARDVYIRMYELWGAAIFSNISVSEQRHMDAVLNLLVKYGVPDPAAGKGIGEFTQAFQGIYDGLIAQGERSLLDALYVGQAIEEMDIDDLQKAMEETVKTDLDTVYGNLQNGSYNHLDAFNAHIANLTP